MKKILFAILIVMILSGVAFSEEKKEIKEGMLAKLNIGDRELTALANSSHFPLWVIPRDRYRQNKYSVFIYDTLPAMQLALEAGAIDIMTIPEPVADYVLANNPKYTVDSVIHSKSVSLAFGFIKGNEELRDKFSRAIDLMQSDYSIYVLEGKYIKSRNIEAVKIEKFEDAPTIKVAVTGDLPPIDYIAPDGNPAGFNTAILSEIGKILHVNIEFVNVNTGGRSAALASGRADVAFWYEIFKDNMKFDVPDNVILSAPYYEWDQTFSLKLK